MQKVGGVRICGLQAHIDWKALRENLEAVRANVANRNSRADPDKVLQIYDRWREALNEAEGLRTERNANAKAMKVGAPLLSSRP